MLSTEHVATSLSELHSAGAVTIKLFRTWFPVMPLNRELPTVLLFLEALWSFLCLPESFLFTALLKANCQARAQVCTCPRAQLGLHHTAASCRGFIFIATLPVLDNRGLYPSSGVTTCIVSGLPQQLLSHPPLMGANWACLFLFLMSLSPVDPYPLTQLPAEPGLA